MWMNLLASIDYIAVLFAAIAGMVLGAVWYLPGVFGTAWRGALGNERWNHPDPRQAVIVRALATGILLGARRGDTGKVYFPPREADPSTGQELDQFVELPDTGTVTTFAIINIPFPGQKIKPPYVAAYILLDGADIPFLHVVTDIDAAEVRMGMHVEAVWKPREEWGLGIDNIEHFRPTGEPDADYDSYRHHL